MHHILILRWTWVKDSLFATKRITFNSNIFMGISKINRLCKCARLVLGIILVILCVNHVDVGLLLSDTFSHLHIFTMHSTSKLFRLHKCVFYYWYEIEFATIIIIAHWFMNRRLWYPKPKQIYICKSLPLNLIRGIKLLLRRSLYYLKLLFCII